MNMKIVLIAAFLGSFAGTIAASRGYTWWLIRDTAVIAGVPVMPYVFNGTTWDRMRGSAAGGIKCKEQP